MMTLSGFLMAAWFQVGFHVPPELLRFFAPPFPDREDYVLERDARVTDEDLILGKTKVQPFFCGTDYYKTSCIDYSSLVKKPYAELRDIVMNIGDYGKNFKSAGVSYTELVPHPSGKPDMVLAYIAFTLPLGIPVPYYMDAEQFPPSEDGKPFGYRYRQNQEYQKRILFSVTPKQSGAWYIEKFGTEPDVYYARLRGAVEIALEMPPSRYYGQVTKRTKQIFKVLGEIPKPGDTPENDSVSRSVLVEKRDGTHESKDGSKEDTATVSK